MRVLVTGAAGFVGAALSLRLAERGDEVLGIDNLNAYYDVELKRARLARLAPHAGFSFRETDIADRTELQQAFESFRPERVAHLAAQAGVRYSLSHPEVYVDSNLVGFLNVLEGCRHHPTEHLVYASSSSVYGANTKLPFSVNDSVDHPVSLYAATKKANEMMAHSYSHLYGMPMTGLRFFTVYGPWGRPDMAYFVFTKHIIEDKPIQVYNYGKHRRDLTYIDDIVEGVVKVLDHPATPNPKWDPDEPDVGSSSAPYRLYNIGNHEPIGLNEMIDAFEQAIGKKAIREMAPMQPGDVEATYADIDSLHADFGFRPTTSIADGARLFVEWYREYYKV